MRKRNLIFKFYTYTLIVNTFGLTNIFLFLDIFNIFKQKQI